MKMRITVSLLLALLLVVGPIAVAQKSGSNADVPVTSTLFDAGNVVDGTNFRIQSDGLGSYININKRLDVVKTWIVLYLDPSLGDWVLETHDSTTRSVLVDFRDPVAGSSTFNAPFNWQFVHARLLSKCRLEGLNYLTIPLNTTVSCPLNAAFTYNGEDYSAHMNPEFDAASNFVSVTCLAADTTGKCNRWSIRPITQADGTVRTIAALTRNTTVKGKQVRTTLGYFYMTFDFEVTNP